ncbi:hypothetical protein D3C84_1246630 [compost metagenome]
MNTFTPKLKAVFVTGTDTTVGQCTIVVRDAVFNDDRPNGTCTSLRIKIPTIVDIVMRNVPTEDVSCARG